MAKHVKIKHANIGMLRAASMLAAVLTVGFLVVSTSRAAFSDTTANTGNTFSSGTVELSDDDAGSALFDVPGMAPGDTHENCIEISYIGDLDSEVRLYGSAGASSDLNDALIVTVERGSGGSFGGTEPANGVTSCTGFSGSQIFTGTISAFLASSNYATGIDSWPTASGTSAVFRFVVQFQTSDNNLQGGTSNVTFTWEAQNT